ncbi:MULTISPECIES: transporter substrate-binding domain-containing protein [Marinomonas]|uniref:histidine kinase n=1 Tax=Marinomonas arctica TaxID=383750 RepID=A0A7H1J266_9GAMM|nr:MULTISPECIES: transporter substrate-binding domain-containing protein [Marinomonas]MCS7488309.1 histidine kinase [Marinomonas sp. BSi20414]QNT04582.1 transporter substrate-binding domain-containing protein [Marinomonas arctica]GGN32929.1 histidine kinase [Marinomonas arctica]
MLSSLTIRTLASLLCLFLGLASLSSPLSARDSNAAVLAGKRVISVGADYNFPPYEFAGEDGEPTGYTVELTQAIAEVMGVHIEIEMADWQTIFEDLHSGRLDVLQGIAYSDERARSIRFSSAHSIVNYSIFARKDSPVINDVTQLKNKEVMIQNASIMHEYLIDNNIQAIIIPVQTHAEALRLLASGKHDYALTANSPSLYLSKEMQLNNIHAIASPISGQRLSYGALPKNEDIIALFNEGLAILKNTGKQQQIYEKWFGALEPAPFPWKKLGLYAASIIIALLLAIGAISIWNAMLRKEVEKRSNQLKSQQEQLIQADKMASLGILVSGVAHEINNPTGLLMLNLPILKAAWIDALPYLAKHAQNDPSFSLAGLKFERLRQELPYLLDEMDQSTLRIRNIVNDLKDFAREEPNEITQEVNINDVVSTAIRLVDTSIRNATDDFELYVDKRDPIIIGSAQRVEQVMINLIINACDAIEKRQDSIRVTTTLSLDEKEVLIVIEDQGKGIDPANLIRLTDPFFTTKREQGGTGLGLSVSAAIINTHQGKLAFDSEVGKGTCVTVSFPVYQPNTAMEGAFSNTDIFELPKKNKSLS